MDATWLELVWWGRSFSQFGRFQFHRVFSFAFSVEKSTRCWVDVDFRSFLSYCVYRKKVFYRVEFLDVNVCSNSSAPRKKSSIFSFATLWVGLIFFLFREIFRVCLTRSKVCYFLVISFVFRAGCVLLRCESWRKAVVFSVIASVARFQGLVDSSSSTVHGKKKCLV